jgi:hypothetical protein
MNVGILSFGNISNRIVDGSPGDWLTSYGLEKDWSALAEGSSAITITSKTSGIPLKIDIISTGPSFGGPINSPADPSVNPVIVELEPFVERAQITKALTLYANNTSNNQTLYEFEFVKQGYNGVFVSAQTQSASVSGVNRYLITTLDYVCRNWDDINDECIYTSAATQNIGSLITSNPDGSPIAGTSNYLHPVNVAHINGSVFLSANNLPGSRLNLTKIKTASFRQFPLIVKPCTDSDLMVESVSQVGILNIPPIGQSNNSIRALYQNNANGFRSFDFRTGTTGPYITFYKNNSQFFTTNDIKWGTSINVSGATSGSGLLSRWLDYGLAPSIPEGPVLGQNSSGGHLPALNPATTIYLKSKVPGVKFEINNIVNAYVQNTATSGFLGVNTIVAGDVIGPITYQTIIEGATAGVDSNPAKNWMGGYNTTIQIGPSGFTGGTIGGLPIGSLPPAGLSL